MDKTSTHANQSGLTGAAAISHRTKLETGRGETFNMPVPGPGAPPIYSAEIKAAICDRLADGETLRAICREEGMPSRRTVYQWVKTDETFASMFAQAQQEQAAALIDKALTAAENACDKDSSMAARVQSDTFLRVAALLDPARWQERKQSGSVTSVTIITTLDIPRAATPDGYVIEAPNGSYEPRQIEAGDIDG